MKKTISFVCIVWVLLVIPVFCLADTSVSIDELGFTVSIPDDSYVFTQNTELSSPLWNTLDIAQEEFIKYLKDNNIYLNAIARDSSYEIVIIGKQSQYYQDIFDINLLDENELLNQLSNLTSNISEKTGLTIDSKEIYSSGELKFISYTGKQSLEHQNVYIKSYFSVVNGFFVQVSLRSYSGALSNDNEATIKSVVDSIKFYEIQKKPIFSSKSISSTLYKALIGGMTALIFGGTGAIINGKRDKNTGKKDANSVACKSNTQTEQIIPKAATEAKKVAFCRKCGAQLIEGSSFCRKCGTPVILVTVEKPGAICASPPAVLCCADETCENINSRDPHFNILPDLENDTPLAVQPFKEGSSSDSAFEIDLLDKNLHPKIRRASIYAEDAEWEKAEACLEAVLDEDPTNSYAYIGKLLVDYRVSSVSDLADYADTLSENKDYKKAVRFADENLSQKLISFTKKSELR